MTVSTTANSKSFTGDGITTAFDFPYPFFDNTDLEIYLVTIATGSAVKLTLTTDYTVSGGNDDVGTVTLAGTYASSPPTSAYDILIARNVPATQSVALVNNAIDDATVMEKALDRLTILTQQAMNPGTQGASLHFPTGDVTNGTLPNLSTRASKYLGFDGSGVPIATAGTTDATPISSFMAPVVAAISAAAVWVAMSLSATIQNLLGAASQSAAQSALGVPSTARKISAGSGLSGGGDFSADRTLSLDPIFLPKYISGLVLSNDAGTPNTILDIATGIAADSTNAYLMQLASAFTKTTGAWAVGTGNGGLDTGSVANNTWYHVYLIRKTADGSIDIAFSTNAGSPTVAGYGAYRRIGAFKTASGTTNILAFLQDGNNFTWATPVGDISAANPGTSAVTRTLASVPLGIRVRALLIAALENSSAGSTAPFPLYLSDMGAADIAASTANASVTTWAQAVGSHCAASAQCQIYTNTSQQIRSRLSVSEANLSELITVLGWSDPRGT